MSSVDEDFVPDDFNLTSALYEASTTDDSERPRCPHCESKNVVHKIDHHIGSASKKPGDWRCDRDDCGQHFDEPIYRSGGE